MKCRDCSFHESGYMWNRCSLIEAEYYYEYNDKPCPFIDDNYIVIENCLELGLKIGDKAGK